MSITDLIGKDPSFRSEIDKLCRIARLDATVLIQGESGTGKELCARAIHDLSLRKPCPFVAVNCGALPIELVENELFGHEEGAFTGASTKRRGLIDEAEGGTLFFDEIDCLPLLAQVKVLRLIQEREYRPLGSSRIVKANLRIVAATNADLESAVRAQRFRSDLYYRVNLVPIFLPPLRLRKEDIPELASHFVAKYAAQFNKHVVGCSSIALARLYSYDWPGNIRELEHILQRAVALSENEVISERDIVFSIRPICETVETFREAKARVISQFELSYLRALMMSHQGNVTKAARSAGKNRRALWQLIRKHRVDVKSYRSQSCETK